MSGQNGDPLQSASGYLQDDGGQAVVTMINPNSQRQPRKRKRPALSCEQCRQRKLKCDRETPCGACVKSHLEACVYKDGQRLGSRPITFAHGEQSQASYGASRPTFRVEAPPTPDTAPPATPSEQHIGRPFTATKVSGTGVLCTPGVTTWPTPLDEISGTFLKNRFYGQSHWMSYLHKSSGVMAGLRGFEADDMGSLKAMLANCKSLAREIKFQEAPDALVGMTAAAIDIPDRVTSDVLVQAYIRTLDKVYRVLDIPRFLRTYEAFWKGDSEVPAHFRTMLSLVIAIGSVFSADHGLSRKLVSKWIYVAQAWLSSPGEKHRLNLDGLRIHCLTILARHANNVDGQMTGVSSISLIRTAMRMGLHVDPSHYASTQVSSTDKELRRRLWATILELDLQATMDSGGVPLIRHDDYDCAAPGNIKDSGLSDKSETAVGLPLESFTDSSIQVLLMRSLPIRMKITRLVNHFRSGFSFKEALAVGEEFVSELRYSSSIIESWRRAKAPITAFQIEIFNLMMHRFLLALHYNFAVLSRKDPTFYYSRKMCQDSAMALLSPPVKSRDGDFYRLMLRGRGLYQDVHTQAVNFLSDDIYAELSGPKYMISTTATSQLEETCAHIEDAVELLRARVEAGETNVKGYAFFACALAQVRAAMTGTESTQALADALRDGLEKSYTALRSRFEGSPPTKITHDLNADGGISNDLIDWFQWDDNFGLGEEDGWMHGLGDMNQMGMQTTGTS